MSDEKLTVLDPHFTLQVASFEGPLDLLLHLIKEHELNILDLPVAFVAARYFAYISLMQRMNLDIAGEYLVMAATLAYLKSRSLLPEPPKEVSEDDEEAGDPREQLIARLLEYQKYKEAGQALAARPVLGRDAFGRGYLPQLPASVEGDADSNLVAGTTNAFHLAQLFEAMVRKLTNKAALQVTRERITIQARMRELIDRLAEARSARFESLFDGAASRYDLVVTLLALLELTKLSLVSLRQLDHLTPIVVSLIRPLEGDEAALYPSERFVSEFDALPPPAST